MKYTITLTEEDFLKFNIEHMKISKMGRLAEKLIWLFCALMTAAGGILFFSVAKGDDYPVYVPIIETVGLVVVALTYMLFFRQKQFNKTLKRMIKLQKKDGKLPFSENSVIEFGDDEIFETTENSNSHIKYDELTNVYFTDNEMYLYINSQQAFIIPYSQLGDDKEKVVDFIKQKTGR